MAIKVLLYDDNEHLRESLKTLLQWADGFEVAAAMPNTDTILVDIKMLQPDIILMDIDMPRLNGVDSVRLIRASLLDIPVLMLTVFEDNDNIIDAICAGASGYLLKKDISGITHSIKDVLNGGAPMTATIAKKVLQLFPQNKAAKPGLPDELTKREKEILSLMVKGNSFKMIATALGLSLDTVRTHVKNIYKKLQVNSVTEAVYKVTNTN